MNASSAESLPLNIAPGLVARDVSTQNVAATKPVTSLALSPDGRYLAVGDAGGRVALRDMGRAGALIIVFNAGKDVGITCMTWLRASKPWTLFIASGNGYLNSISFNDGVEDFHPHNTAVWAPGLITYLSVNEDGSQIAASYDQAVKIFTLPFSEGVPARTGPASSFLINQAYSPVLGVPVRDILRAVGLQYIDKHQLIVAFFGSIKVYNTDPNSTRDAMWEIKVPKGTNIGSFALSPSRTYIVATNLHDGVDWYSVKGKEYISQTKIPDTYNTRNYILPVQFITDSTFVAGHNHGKLVMGTNGVDRITSHGALKFRPSKHLSVATSEGQFQVVYAVDSTVTHIRYLLSEGLEATATSIEPQVMKDDLIKLSTTPPPDKASNHMKSRSVGFAEPEAQTIPSHDYDTPLQPVPFDLSLTSVNSTVFHTPGETPAFERRAGKSTFHLEGSGVAGPLAAGDGGSGVEPDWFSTPMGRLSRPSMSTSWPLPDPPSPGSESNEVPLPRPSSRMNLSDMLGKRALTSKAGGAALQQEPLSVYYQHDLGAQRTHANQGYMQLGANRNSQFAPFSRGNGRLDDVGFDDRSNANHDETQDVTHVDFDETDDSRDLDGGQGPSPTSGSCVAGIRSVVSERLGLITRQGWSAAKANPKFASIVFLSIAMCFLALASTRSLTHGAIISTPMIKNSQGLRSAALYPVNDDLEDDGGEGYDEDFEGGDNDCDTIVLTETKVLTITKTITNTMTSTVTANSRPTARRAQKSRRR